VKEEEKEEDNEERGEVIVMFQVIYT